MRIEFPRRTLAADATFSGVGIHGGEIAHVTVRPGADGITFVRNTNRWQAVPANVTETTRSTKLGEIRMVEHLMSAFAELARKPLDFAWNIVLIKNPPGNMVIDINRYAIWAVQN